MGEAICLLVSKCPEMAVLNAFSDHQTQVQGLKQPLPAVTRPLVGMHHPEAAFLDSL